MRGHDAKYTPIPHSHSLIDKNRDIKIFCDLSKISLSLKKKFNKIQFIETESLNKILSEIKEKKFIVDKSARLRWSGTNKIFILAQKKFP